MGTPLKKSRGINNLLRLILEPYCSIFLADLETEVLVVESSRFKYQGKRDG
jgi:hypothetical protein